MKNLFFAVHPDDETLGAGGTILKLKKLGDQNYWCILTSMGENPRFTVQQRKQRKAEIDKVRKEFGFKKVYELELETMTLDTLPLSTIISKVAEVVEDVNPDRIFLPFKHDAHSDHKVAYSALIPFAKTFRYPSIKEVYCMETISETNAAMMDVRDLFAANTYFDVTSTFAKKLEIMKIYSSELGKHPFPRSLRTIEALGTLRGSEAGVEYAEAFMLLKKIN